MEDIKELTKNILLSDDFELIDSCTKSSCIRIIIKKDNRTISCDYKTINKGADIEVISAKYI